jgi:molybdenum cofactor cytidylyltransferase
MLRFAANLGTVHSPRERQRSASLVREPRPPRENRERVPTICEMTIVILAAGAARRMGSPKLLLPLDGRPLIARVLEAAARWPCVVVAGSGLAAALESPALRIVRNDAPERGMAHSLALADAVVDRSEAIAVLLGDLPDITPAAIAAVVDIYDESVDVVVPRHGETFVHPVVFGPRARRKIAALPDGDTIRGLRDDPSLRRRIVPADGSALTDIDTPGDYRKLVRRNLPES